MPESASSPCRRPPVEPAAVLRRLFPKRSQLEAALDGDGSLADACLRNASSCVWRPTISGRPSWLCRLAGCARGHPVRRPGDFLSTFGLVLGPALTAALTDGGRRISQLPSFTSQLPRSPPVDRISMLANSSRLGGLSLMVVRVITVTLLLHSCQLRRVEDVFKGVRESQRVGIAK
jgi:hypothetical protein